MTSRAILRRRKIVSDYLNVPVCSSRSFQTIGQGQLCQHINTPDCTSRADPGNQTSEHFRENSEALDLSKQLLGCSTVGIFRDKTYGITAQSYRNGRSDCNWSMGLRLMSEPRCYASTATARQPDLGSDDEDKEEVAAKKVKETSPEECDEAVVGLSTAKAKAKAKKLQESQSLDTPILKKLWATFLGIGPALGAVASMSRPHLVNMCKYMGISSIGTDSYLRYMLRKRLQSIKNDDKLIQAEGVESLSEAELREDCRERGMVGAHSVEEMRQQLRDWLDLSLNHSVPSSLLILSRAFKVSGKLRPEEAVQATLSSLPDEVVDTVGITSLPSEDSVSERRRKLDFLEMQEELIKEEEEKEEEEKARKKESARGEVDVALKEMTVPTAKEAQQAARARALDKQEQLCELSRALAVLASASSVSREREEFLRLVNKEIELYNSMVDKDGMDGEVEAMKAYKAASDDSEDGAEVPRRDMISSALIDKVDSMLQNLEKEIDDVDAKIGDHWRILDRDYDGKVTPEEVAAAAMYLKDTLGKEGVQELISNLSKDADGKILVEDIVRLGSRVKGGSTAESEEMR
ncbi:hypothetical protein CDL12_28382 [Handroanthus impetiginosus]|uniref:Mitochondrial proton/calcium exchanger protein n=1 Tax=Handroanthus impetiginosus TaxID=429701 RepID=A0A2G9G1G7_9LAMI|nr:hypothetical protein CDL12_28382 [Handroanthus impetiginosus]